MSKKVISIKQGCIQTVANYLREKGIDPKGMTTGELIAICLYYYKQDGRQAQTNEE